eukprot:4812260-Ditylum_brightwellii.AAC.1
MAIPPALYGCIASHSSFSLKHFVNIATEAIHHNYRMDIKVLLVKSCKTKFNICKGDKVA